MEPLIPQRPEAQRLDRKRLTLVFVGLCLLGGAAFLGMTTRQGIQRIEYAGEDVGEGEGRGQSLSVSKELHIPTSYRHIRHPEPEAPPLPVVAPVSEVRTSTGAESNPFVHPIATTTRPPRPPKPPRPVPTPATGRDQDPRPAPGAQPSAPPKVNRWLFANVKDDGAIAAAPFPEPSVDQDGPQDGQPSAQGKRGAHLFPQATWAIPEDPTKVLYRSQILNGILQHAINSDHPGLIRILLSEQVEDKFNQGVVLLPQYTILLGQQDGAVKYGQSRLAVSIDSAELPDGTVIAFNKARLADDQGAAGVAGAVNNHYVKLGISAVLTALLSVGSRAAGGTASGFQPSLGQDFSRDVTQSINQSGQQIVKRELDVAPTITIPHGTPVSIALSENVSFQTGPTRVRK